MLSLPPIPQPCTDPTPATHATGQFKRDIRVCSTQLTTPHPKIECPDIFIDNSEMKAQQAAAFVEKTNKSAEDARCLLNWLVPPAGVVSALWTLMSRNWFSRL